MKGRDVRLSALLQTNLKMGIRDLWAAVSPASKVRNLTQIAITEGFEKKRYHERCLFIGIDASIWMNEAQMAINVKPGRGTRAGENPAVRILFYRLCRLLTLPIIPVFVFDGPDRPKVKRGVNVKTEKSHWLSSPFRKFIEAFGFFWYMAPGEAEADLAELNRRNHIDAIFSEDNDNLVFGACCVIRMSNVKEASDQVTVYNSASIETNPLVSLSREALFLMAILCEGDYDKVGLKGCGWKTARLLAQSELAKSLFLAASMSSSRAGLRDFLHDWRPKLRTLLVRDPQNILGRRYPSLAKNITDNFPSVDVVLRYAQPLTSWTMDRIPDTKSWQLRWPSLTKIATLCEKYFSWGSSGDIVSRFKETLWPGITVRHLLLLPDLGEFLARYASEGFVADEPPTNIHILRICQARLGPGTRSTNPNVCGYTIQIATRGVLNDTALGLDPALRSLMQESDCHATSFWVPGSILRSALPNLVKHFKGKEVISPVENYPPIIAPSLELPPPHSQLPIAVAFRPGVSVADPIVIEASRANPDFIYNEIQEFVQRSSTGARPDLFTSPPPETRDQEFLQGSSTGAGFGSVFLGHIDLCTPSPSP